MNRSDYTDDHDDNWAAICYRGAVASAIRGKRGQAFLKELRDALDAMEKKELIADKFEADGSFCALGVIAHKRKLNMKTLDVGDPDRVGDDFGIASSLAREIMYINDDACPVYGKESPEQRWRTVRAWVEQNIIND